MPAFVGLILEWIVTSTLGRVMWAAVSWWFLQGIIPVVINAINGATGNPFSLIPSGAWWLLDCSGFDIWVPKIMSALVISFIIRRVANK